MRSTLPTALLASALFHAGLFALFGLAPDVRVRLVSLVRAEPSPAVEFEVVRGLGGAGARRATGSVPDAGDGLPALAAAPTPERARTTRPRKAAQLEAERLASRGELARLLGEVAAGGPVLSGAVDGAGALPAKSVTAEALALAATSAGLSMPGGGAGISTGTGGGDPGSGAAGLRGSGSGRGGGLADLGGTGRGGGRGRDDAYARLHAHVRARAAGCYPRAAQKRAQGGTAEVRVCVGPAGEVRNLSLARSSGSELLDDAALDCVIRGAAPLPVVPDCVVVPVEFHRR